MPSLKYSSLIGGEIGFTPQLETPATSDQQTQCAYEMNKEDEVATDP